MIPLAEAAALLAALGSQGRPQVVSLVAALGRVLARDVAAPESLPPFPRSGVDGYALRADQTAGVRSGAPIALALAGEIWAGESGASLAPGAAVRIATGAPVPPGADAVVRLEEVTPGSGRVLVYRPVLAGENVAAVGEDVRAGQVVLRVGHRLRGVEVGLLAALGVERVAVVARPRVAILCTGDELVEAGRQPGPGQVRNSASLCLAALVREAGGEAHYLGCARDEAPAIARLAAEARGFDAVLSTGGASVGGKDLVRPALALLGARELFWRVAMKPGTPTLAADWQGRPFIGLSGNPAAAVTAFDLLVRPLLGRMAGRRAPALAAGSAVLDQDVGRPAAVTLCLRARIYPGAGGGLRADISLAQRAGILSTMAFANGYATVPPSREPPRAGDTVAVLYHRETPVEDLPCTWAGSCNPAVDSL